MAAPERLTSRAARDDFLSAEARASVLLGCYFSSSPSRKKPIVLALGSWQGARVQLSGLERLASLQEFDPWLGQPADWIGGFDLPFGLPRELVETLGWSTQWDACTAPEHGQSRLGLRLKLTHAQRDLLVDDASGDSLDAVLCLVQTAWAQSRHAQGAPCHGLPDDMDPLEGWIITA